VARPYQVDGLELTLSTSIGVALFPDDATEVNPLIAAADGALYAAKRSGKNCCCTAQALRAIEGQQEAMTHA
jgi:predicted signal transduction protein with EAL and GGDEF domain